MDKIPTGDARPPSGAIARGAVRECYNRAAPHRRPLHKAAYTDRSCPKLSAHVGDALLGICLSSGRWLRRQLQHGRLLTLT